MIPKMVARSMAYVVILLISCGAFAQQAAVPDRARQAFRTPGGVETGVAASDRRCW